MLRSDPELLAAPEVSIRFCLAEDLAEAGPFEPIFIDYRDSERPTTGWSRSRGHDAGAAEDHQEARGGSDG